MNVRSLINQIQVYNPDVEVELLERCYRFAQEAHEGQKRKSGEPYFTHCVKTAEILAELRMDTHTICAGLLHDMLEDTSITREKLQVHFGSDIAKLIEGVTKIGQYRPSVGAPTTGTPITVEDRAHRKRQAETYRKLLLATAEDIRVILIKLADRLHNMETLEYLTSEKRQRIAKETLEVYAPIARGLGIWRIMSRLEDLAFKHLYPDEYRKIADSLDQKLTEREAYCDKMVEEIRQVLEEHGVHANVYGRTKHIYSIYRKMEKKGTPFSEIRDLVGLRVLVKTEVDCYIALGILHRKWKHHRDRFQDWIGQNKKPNQYRSLHTTILDDGQSVEIQIRTYKMHKTAEQGIAAHLKEGIPTDKEGRSILARYKQILEDIQEAPNSPHQFVESVKLELYQDEVYVFSPKGDLFKLPAGATVIDFAYKIHTEIGNTCVGAEVNGIIAPIRQVLEDGDQVKIRTHPNGKPSKSWIQNGYVKTARARGKINHWFREKIREDAPKLGKRLLEEELRLFCPNARDYLNSPELLNIAKQLELKDLEELFARIGKGDESVTAIRVANLLKAKVLNPETVEEGKPEREPESAAIQVENNMNLSTLRFMRCCNPIPGDQVVGYLTRGRGVSVHRDGCIRIVNDPERLLGVRWVEKPMSENGDHPPEVFPVKIFVECSDRRGMLGEITTAIGQCGVNIRSGNFQPPTVPLDATDNLTIEVTGAEQLDKVLEAIRQLKGVQRVIRIS